MATEKWNEFLAWRGIEPGDECKECGGTGWITYGSTATYWGGVGGAAMTPGVCNHCWGSGSRSIIWPSHKLLRAVHDRGNGDGV